MVIEKAIVAAAEAVAPEATAAAEAGLAQLARRVLPEYAVGTITDALQTEQLETCAAISCVDTAAGRQLLIHAGDWNTASDITNVFKTEGFNLDTSKLSIMIGPRVSSTLENILPALTDAQGAIRPIKVIPSPRDM